MKAAWSNSGDEWQSSAVPVSLIRWSDVLRIWLRAAGLILPVAALGAVAGYALSYAVTPIYDAKATLLMDRPNPGRLDNAADATAQDAQQRANLTRSQVDILRSSEIASRVIRQLHLAGSPMFNPAPSLSSRLLGEMKSLLERIGLRHSDPVSESGESELVSAFLSRLTVNQQADTYLLEVGFRAPDPVLAAQVVNSEVANYMDWSREQRTHAIDNARSWLQGALVQAHQRVVDAETAVQDFNRSGVLLNVDGRTALDQGLAQLTADLATAQARLVQSQARADEIRRLQQSGQNAGIAAMSGSKVLQELQAKYEQSRAHLAALQKQFGPQYPPAMEASAETNELNAAIGRGIHDFVGGEISQANIARATVDRLEKALEQMKHQVVEAESARSKLTRLDGAAGVERANYLALLQKLRSYDNVDKLAKADITILSPAMPPPLPTAPRRGLLAAFGLLLAGAFACLLVVWRSAKRDVVQHSLDASSLTGIPCLGITPVLGLRRRNEIDRRHIDYSFFQEELRSICAALVRGRSGSIRSGITLMVTSSLPGEGKSTFSRELGRFAAENGIKTLIVRADPPGRTHRRERDTIKSHDKNSLPLLETEWIAPATMLGPQNSSQCISEWRREFDLVIFDTPPVTAMAESLILAPLVDTTIILARVDHTPRSLLTGVAGQIAEAGGRLSGVVVTFVQLSGKRGMVPSDSAYYFRRNRSYHRRLLEGRTAGRA